MAGLCEGGQESQVKVQLGPGMSADVPPWPGPASRAACSSSFSSLPVMRGRMMWATPTQDVRASAACVSRS